MKTDAQLQQKVIAKLARELSTSAVAISVGVNEGIVTLAGHVASYADKWDAEHAVQTVKWIQALVSTLDVRLPASSARDDADIARATNNALVSSILVPTGAVHVMVEAGHVTLAGEMEWNFQRQAATRVVRTLLGVTGITNRITITPQQISIMENERIDTALLRRTHRRARRVPITVEIRPVADTRSEYGITKNMVSS
jgi:osmotically-inducible protein OsmY